MTDPPTPSPTPQPAPQSSAPLAKQTQPPPTLSPHAPLPPIPSSSNRPPAPSPKPEPTLIPTPSAPPTTVATNVPTTAPPAQTPPTTTSAHPCTSTRSNVPPDSPSSAQRRTKGGRRAANPHLTEEERRRERVLKNRESAMKSLQKKKRYTEDLEHRAVALARRNAELKEKIRVLLIRLNGMSVNPGPVPLQAIHTATCAPTFQAADPSFRLQQQQQQQQPQPQQPQQQPPMFAQQTAQTGNMGAANLNTQGKQSVGHHTMQPSSEQSVVSSALPTNIGSASSNGAVSSSFPLDDWVPNLPDAFLTPGANAVPPSAITSTPSDAGFSSTQQTSNSGNGESDVGDSFLGLGMGMTVGLGSGSTLNSPNLGMQGNLQETQFGLGNPSDSTDKMGAPFDLPHMACSQ